MRTAARKDTNQTPIVEALRRAGYSVAVIHRLGQGIPDLLIGVDDGKGGVNLLLEVKVPGEKLTPDETKWHAAWKGQVAIVTSPEEALDYAFMFRCVERTD